MKAVYQIKYMRIMCFVTAMSFYLALLTGCAGQTLSDSLPQDRVFITDDNTDDSMDDIHAENRVPHKENNGSAGDETTEQELYIYVIEDEGAVITGLQEEYKILLQQNMSNDKITIPDTLGGYPVVEIGDRVFEDIRLKRVHLPDSVEVIGDSAFRNTGLEDINIPECYHPDKPAVGYLTLLEFHGEGI